MNNKNIPSNFYSDDNPMIPEDPFFGLAGIDLRDRILPALCGPMGRIMPEGTNGNGVQK